MDERAISEVPHALPDASSSVIVHFPSISIGTRRYSWMLLSAYDDCQESRTLTFVNGERYSRLDTFDGDGAGVAVRTRR